MTTKSEILKKMAQVSETDCADTAHEYLIELIDAGMDFPDAESRVLNHFSGVDQEELTQAYDA